MKKTIFQINEIRCKCAVHSSLKSVHRLCFVILLSLLVLTNSLVCFSQEATPQENKIDRLMWLTGFWQVASGDNINYEQWERKDNHTLLGTSYCMKDGDTIVFEKMQTIDFQFVKLENSVEISGIAYNRKGGAVVATDSIHYWIEDKDYWEDKFLEKKVVVTGILKIRQDEAVFLDTGELKMQGIPVYSEEELNNYPKRYWISNATCRLAEE